MPALCLAVWGLQVPGLNWGVALFGWSPLDWVSHLARPIDLARDFPSGIAGYSRSSFMYVYPLASKWIGLSPENLLPLVVLFEIFFLACCASVFSNALIPSQPRIAASVFGILLISSSARGMELSNFGGPFFWGLYYNVADGLRLLGLAFFLRGRLRLAAVLLALSFTVHPIMALMAGIFILGYVIVQFRAIRLIEVIIGSVLFASISGAWLLLKFSDANFSSAQIGAETWISISKAFNFHFFPVDYGMLTTEHDTRVLPLLALASLAMFYMPRVCQDDMKCRAIIAGLVLLSLFTIAGLLISANIASPTLIKLSLPRASDMIILVCLAITICGLVQDISGDKTWTCVLAWAVLLSPFVMKPGFPALPVFLLIVPRLKEHWNSGRTLSIRSAPILLCILLVLLACAFALTGILELRHWRGYLGSLRFWQLVVLASAVMLTLTTIRRFKASSFNHQQMLLAATLGSTVLLASMWQIRSIPADAERVLGHDYLAAQRWANSSTEPSALFMVDPSIHYGWRDFSSRSSFGNLREWLHTSWLYDSREESYREGRKRFDELGIELAPYLKYKPPIEGYNQLNIDVRKRFYDMRPEWFNAMAVRYGVDYVVMAKSGIHQTYPFTAAFENKNFVVYKLSQQ